MAQVLVFDVNGTLLETSALAPALRAIFGPEYSVEQWFDQVLTYAMATSLADDYRDFGDVALSVLEMAAKERKVDVEDRQKLRMRQAMKELPAFPDVKRALPRLRTAGFKLAVLSNSGSASLEQVLRNAGIAGLFDAVFSVEHMGRFKPAVEVYRTTAKMLGVETGEMLMVAAHAWDLLGAARAGCKTAFIRRQAKAPYPGAPHPDYVARDLYVLADELVGSPRKRMAASYAMAGGLLAIGALRGAAVLGRSRRTKTDAVVS